MSNHISLQSYARSQMMGIRAAATPIRGSAESLLDAGEEVVLDFKGISATQSFVDELVGGLVLRYGPSVLQRVIFKGCSPDVRAILRFVTSDRAEQFHQTQARTADTACQVRGSHFRQVACSAL